MLTQVREEVDVWRWAQNGGGKEEREGRADKVESILEGEGRKNEWGVVEQSAGGPMLIFVKFPWKSAPAVSILW